MQIDLSAKSNTRKDGRPRLSALVKAKCLDCCAGQPLEVKYCTVKGCPLWPVRTGRYQKTPTQEALENEEPS